MSSENLSARTIKKRKPRNAALPSGQSGISDTILRQWRNERPDIINDVFEISLMVNRLSILQRDMQASLSQTDGELRSGMNLLYALRRVGTPYAQRPTDLYRLLGVTSGAVTYMIGTMTKLGLVRSLDDSGDRRSRMIALTPKGVELVDAHMDAAAPRLGATLDGLAVRERKAMLRSLTLLARRWETYIDFVRDSSPQ